MSSSIRACRWRCCSCECPPSCSVLSSPKPWREAKIKLAQIFVCVFVGYLDHCKSRLKAGVMIVLTNRKNWLAFGSLFQFPHHCGIGHFRRLLAFLKVTGRFPQHSAKCLMLTKRATIHSHCCINPVFVPSSPENLLIHCIFPTISVTLSAFWANVTCLWLCWVTIWLYVIRPNPVF